MDAMTKKQGTEEMHSLHSLIDDEIAQEIGLNAHEYLEECFYNEVSVLDRDKFNAIPEIVKSDLTIMVSVACPAVRFKLRRGPSPKYRWPSDRTTAISPTHFARCCHC